MTRSLSDKEVLRQRRRLRLPDYDYTQPGTYFVTTCSFERECLFGQVVDCRMQRSAIGRIAHERWMAIPAHHPGVDIDAFVVMPNHVHGIVRIAAIREHGGPDTTPIAPSRGSARGPKPQSLGAIVGSFKSAVSRLARRAHERGPDPIWQLDFHDHIIRDDASLERIREYIAANPARWDTDPENPACGRTAGATQASPPHSDCDCGIHDGFTP